MTVFALRLPEDLKDKAAAQAAETGVSLNQFIAVAVASRVGAQAEAERYFRTRGARAKSGRAKALLARAGVGNEPRDDDRNERP
ncbi:MAG TPA: toxin-antitoxin system HicB family antitoxin [Stellaceae bacterium]|nr:toxin-antitoxin system HicB family antitoxin [Stellaceae bacterium]